jgi:hypothetical protein
LEKRLIPHALTITLQVTVKLVPHYLIDCALRPLLSPLDMTRGNEEM